MVKNALFCIVLILLGISYSSCSYATAKTSERLSKLQKLFEENTVYSEEIPSDSIIAWEEQLEPILEQNKEYETLFQLKQMAVCAYAGRGDMNTAIDHARTMYNKAKEMNHATGIALSIRAIGDAYLSANMDKEAVEAYEEALERSDADEYKTKILPNLIMTLSKMKEFEKAHNYLKQLDKLFVQNSSEPLYFFLISCYAHYYLQTGNTDNAKMVLAKADSVCKKRNDFAYYRSITDYLYANYYQSIGLYDKALEQYNILRSRGPRQSPNKVALLDEEQAQLLAKAGQIDEACRTYQLANAKKDSMNAISYSRQINDLRTNYQIDQIEIESQIEQNQMIFWAIIAILFVLFLITLLIIRIRNQNKRLIESKAQLKRAKSYAESSIKTKSLFLSNMSHEIRTPLNALSGFSSILTEMSVDSETRQQCNEIIQQNSELLLKLINDVIDLSSLEVGKLTFNFRKCDAVSTCRNVVNTVEKVKQTQAAVIFSTDLESLELTTDDSRLQQVLINLLINATKFTTQGTITLELSKTSETTALFSVTDTGCGIPLEKQKQIFNRFEKLNEGAQGTGLGLSICQLIIKQIGGTIGIDPEYTNGTRFVFTHPIHLENRKEKTE